MPKGKKPINARTIGIAQRNAKALQMRKEGASWNTIMHACGFSTASAANQAIKKEMALIPYEHAADLKIIMRERLEAMVASVYEQASGGDYAAVDRILKIMERQAKLDGLDAPPAQLDAATQAIVMLAEKMTNKEDWERLIAQVTTQQPASESEADAPDNP